MYSVMIHVHLTANAITPEPELLPSQKAVVFNCAMHHKIIITSQYVLVIHVTLFTKKQVILCEIY